MGYTKHAIKGVSWMTAGRAVTRILAFVKIAVLARVLTPSQFGIFGIATLVLAFLETLTETGINIVLIQSKKEINEYINSAWVVSIVRGIIIAGILIFASPLIASFFKTPAALNLLLFISLVPFVRGFINPSEVKFQKELRFNMQFLFTSLLFLSDALTAVVVALSTHSVYSLAWGMLIAAFLEVVISHLLIKPRPSFAVERTYFKEIFQRGIWVTGYTVFNYIAENADNAVVGRIMGSASLGLYQMAYKISILPITEVSDVVSSVAFPVFAKITDDLPRLRKAFLKILLLVTVGAGFLGGVIFYFPILIIIVLLGTKWLGIVQVLQVLALYGILRTVSGPVSALFLAKGKQKYITAMIFVRFSVLLVTIFPFVRLFGLVGAGYSQLLSVVCELPILCYFVIKLLRKENS